MAPVAPGQPSSHQEPYCYNCGVQGHWMFACPEPTREVPAGLQQWQSKHQDQPPDRSHSSRDGKGAVITRYPPPPHQAGPTTPYGIPPSHLPPHPSYPPAGSPLPPQGYPHPYPPAPPGYGNSYAGSPPAPYPTYPPNPSPGGPPPPGPPPPSGYGQAQPPYGQPPYAPAPYGNYPPQGYYQSGPPPPPAGPYPPGPYPPQQYPPPGPYPPPSEYPFPPGPLAHYTGPPPPPSAGPYPPGNDWAPPPPGYGPPPPSLPRPPARTTNSPRPRDNRNGRDQRDHRDNRDRDRRDRLNWDRGRRHNQEEARRPSNTQKDKPRSSNRDISLTPAPTRPNLPVKKPEWDQSASRKDKQARDNASVTSLPEKKKEKKEKKEEVVEEKPDIGEELSFSQKDLAIVFPEPGKTKEADPVGIPLPTEYNDDPTIPPAYNSTVIKSTFFSEENQIEFSASIRNSDDWKFMKLDPVFKLYDGMIFRQFPSSSHEYATYKPTSPPSPSAIIKLPPRFKINRENFENWKRENSLSDDAGTSQERGEDRSIVVSNKRRLEAPDGVDDRETKRTRPSPPRRKSPSDEYSRRRSPTRRPRSPQLSIGRDPWDPLAGESSDHDRRPLSRHERKRSYSSSDDRPAKSKTRHDSGYYSGQSQDKYASHREREREREDDRVRGQDRDHERGRKTIDRGRYQRRESLSRSRSRSSPPRRARSSSWESRGSVDSYGGATEGLSLLDCELLGLAAPDEPSELSGDKKKPRKGIEDSRKREQGERKRDEDDRRRDDRKRYNPSAKRQKPAREVTAAFSRRW